MGRTYKLFTATVGTTNAAASLRVTKKTRIRCIFFSVAAVGGAAVDGRYLIELSKQNVISTAVNDTPETVVAGFAYSTNIASASFGSNASIICEIPCEVGDTLYLNQIASGTAMSALTHSIYMFTSD